MKNIILICSSVILSLALAKPGFADEHFPFVAQVSKDSVNVRSGPNTNFSKVDKLKKGDQVVVLGRSYDWFKVQPTVGTHEYIRSDYLKVTQGNIASVTGDNVNVRSTDNSDAASLGELKEGTLVKILAQENGWSQLASVAGTAVWIQQDFLSEVSPEVPTAMLIPTVPTPSTTVIAQAPVAPSMPVSPWVSMRGTVEALVQPLGNNVHYEIVMGDKSVFLLQDIPNISFFCNLVVTIEGAIIPDPQKKFMYPLLHINKISMVL